MRKINQIMMITVSMLLSLVLITSSVVSTTFAKYATTGKASASARVAKWGVNIEVSAIGDLPDGIKCVESDGKLMFTGITADSDSTFRLGPGGDYSDKISVKFSGTAEVKLKVVVMFDVVATTSAVSSDVLNPPKYFIPMGFTFSAWTANGAKAVDKGFASGPWNYADSLNGVQDAAESAYVESLMEKIDVDGDNNYIEKIFEPNAAIVFHPIKNAQPDESVSINEFRLGFEWPAEYSDSNTGFDYDKIGEYMIDYLADSTFGINYTVIIEQVR